ncbi:hypothetical protein FJ959_22985 [Mesorhizobium sp. B2-2-4]|uniref:hypothetical protein n=1 Tax=unclassified Mesorhizobium TaxID=325217 RepID=UPI001126DEC5|nr:MULTISPECIES: hypothetical protein [unclassified Mesorhizobium]MBZ9961177.1 hypothetical protein [Mesorhizobium sp. BR1-1-14]TPL50596.1 hypothetical protein FJ942_23415 [Mesorhizobium sp. B2-4-2]TPM52260.1 hypothetical protein FJ959_22985 [Mesorhizobium sp. B2-2-4]TPM61427.1 hypothetical protein FJ965_23415 [Mesorhizobium sp. B2-2-1]TPN64510.1 hypothetical protein FJ984_20135 [Mesorhizobium sp. B1-1-3]
MLRIASIAAIVDQHASNAAFLWFRRRHEIDRPILGETDIGRIDQRLNANLDGLMASGKAGWEAAQAHFADYAELGELFVLGALALRWGDSEAVASAIDAAATLGEVGVSGLSGAIARTPRENLRPFMADWLDARDARLRALGLAALWHHRVDPGARLGVLLSDPCPDVRGRAFRLAGGLKRRDLLPAVLAGLEGDTPKERLTAALAACLLGEARSAHSALDRIVLAEPGLAPAAIEMRLLTTPLKTGRGWLQDHLKQSALRATATAAIGLFGDRSVMPWLIAKMREPELVFAAGLALRDLFDVDFNDTNLFTIDPALLGREFEFLTASPLPVADRITAWWDEVRGGGNHEPFYSMRRLRLDAIRAALVEPDAPLTDWRRTRRFPAWM